MILRRLVTTLLILVVSPVDATAQSFLGLTLAGSSTTINGDPPPNGVFRGRAGFTVRATGGLEVGEGVFLMAQPGYARRGTDVAFAVPGPGVGEGLSELSVGYVSIPIGLRVRSLTSRIYITSSVDFGYVVDATLATVISAPAPLPGGDEPALGVEEDVLANLNPWDISAGLALGVLIPIGKPTLTLELGWGQSLLNATKNNLLPVEWDLPPRFKFSGFGVSAGVQFDLGRAADGGL
jgi:hypothetical protein